MFLKFTATFTCKRLYCGFGDPINHLNKVENFLADFISLANDVQLGIFLNCFFLFLGFPYLWMSLVGLLGKSNCLSHVQSSSIFVFFILSLKFDKALLASFVE